MSRCINLRPYEARAFAREATRLNQPHFSDVRAALDYHGYIQLDPLNICGRLHDLILRNRVADYEEGELLRTLHGKPRQHTEQSRPRAGFEHYIPGDGILVAWPLSAYPYIRAYLERIHPSTTRRPLSSSEDVLAQKIISEITDRGPLMSDDLDHEGRSQTAWGSYGRLTKIVLEKLFAAGQLLITERRGFRRVYDLASRVLPPFETRDLPSDQELNRWRALLRIRQRRLVTLRKADLRELGELVQAVEIDGKTNAYCLKEDVSLLDKASPPDPLGPCLLAPLDPLVYDRKLTRAVWNFDYTWEVYTPADARKRGYYSLPVLSGFELVGDIEPRADRKGRRLRVISRRVKRGYSTSLAVRNLAVFLGLR